MKCGTLRHGIARDFTNSMEPYATDIWGERWFKWNDASPKTQYRYRDRTQVTVYTYERWTSWTGYSDTYRAADTNTQVRTRTLYRYKKR